MKEYIATITTKDNIVLPGIFYKPKTSTKKALIYLHGTGGHDVFVRKNNYDNFAKILSKKNIGLLAFNNRGAHIVDTKKVSSKKQSYYTYTGSAFELIDDCVEDIAGCIEYLKSNKIEEFYLMGHSTGANKVCVWDNKMRKNNKISKYVLFGGCDDTGILYEDLGEHLFSKLVRQSLEKVQNGEGEETFSISGNFINVMSYKSFLDMANPDGSYNIFPFLEAFRHIDLSSEKELFSEYRSIKKPTLVIYGEEDEFLQNGFQETQDILMRFSNKNHEFMSIKGGDHGCSEHKDKLFKEVSSWLSR